MLWGNQKRSREHRDAGALPQNRVEDGEVFLQYEVASQIDDPVKDTAVDSVQNDDCDQRHCQQKDGGTTGKKGIESQIKTKQESVEKSTKIDFEEV